MNYLFGQQKPVPAAAPAAPAPPAAPPVDPVAHHAALEARATDLEGKLAKVDADMDALKAQFRANPRNGASIKQRLQHLFQQKKMYEGQLAVVHSGTLSLGRRAFPFCPAGRRAARAPQPHLATPHPPPPPPPPLPQ